MRMPSLTLPILLVLAGCQEREEILCPTATHAVQGSPAPAGAPIDRSCVGKPAAPSCNTMRFCGLASRVLKREGIPEATYTYYDADGEEVARAVTDASGSYCAKIPVEPAGFTGRIALSAMGYRTHDGVFAAMPFAFSHDDVSFGIEVEGDLQFLFPALGAPAPDSNKAILDPFMLDCAFKWLPPLAVEIDRPYEKRFYVDEGPTLKENVAGSFAGQISGALFVNVEPGPVVATFRLLDAGGQPGAVIGTARGEARAGLWTGIPAFPQ